MNTAEYISFLENTIIELYERLEQEKSVLEKKVSELEKRLKLYENPHTPPSKQMINKKRKEKEVRKGKRGAPKGHKGATRKRPKPEEVIPVPLECCPNCNHELGEPIDTETKIIEEMSPPKKIKVTQYNLDIYKCPNCGAVVKAKHKDCPQKGNFGIILLVYITMLKYHLRGVIRKIQDFLTYNNSFEISIMGINNILLRVGDACKNGYEEIHQRIINSKWIYMDETGIKVNGEKWWLWIFRTNANDVFVVIRKSRGRKVLKEIFGDDFQVVGVSDGWRAYKCYRKLQRCWAHLIREVDDFKDKSENGKRLSEEIHKKYKKLKDFLSKDPTMDEREAQKIIFDKEIEELVSKYNQFKELKKSVTYIKNGLGCWYTCLLYPGMEPTNNLGEQAMREHVIMRKIIGTFRSENGSEKYQYIASLLATWKLQEKNIFEELEALLRMELCLK